MANSKAQATILGAFAVNTGTVTTPTWTTVNEIRSIKTSGRGLGKEEVTNFNSNATEFAPTISNSPSWTLSGNYVPNDTGFAYLQAASISTTPALVQCKYTDVKRGTESTAGDTWTFFAVIEACDVMTYDPKKVSEFEVKLQCSNGVTFVAGS
jgi:hypothetical protein